MFDLIGKRKWFYTFSIIILLVGLFGLWKYDLRFSIDFQGGSLLELKTEKEVSTEPMFKVMEELGYKDSIVQSLGVNSISIRSKSKYFDPKKYKEQLASTPTVEETTSTATVVVTPEKNPKKASSPEATVIANNQTSQIDNPAALTSEEQKKIIEKVTELFGKTEVVQLQSIGPTIGEELTQKTIWAVILASLFIVLYVAYSFSNLPAPASSWRFGLVTVFALIHDVIFVLGVTAMLGHFIGLEIDALYVVALLNIMSFSVHDSIVSLDRIRENLTRLSGQPFESIVNRSLLQTLVRSLNINLTILFTLIALYLFGTGSIKHFILVLIIGIVEGTYSSIFVASPLLVTWQNWSQKNQKQ